MVILGEFDAEKYGEAAEAVNAPYVKRLKR